MSHLFRKNALLKPLREELLVHRGRERAPAHLLWQKWMTSPANWPIKFLPATSCASAASFKASSSVSAAAEPAPTCAAMSSPSPVPAAPTDVHHLHLVTHQSPSTATSLWTSAEPENKCVTWPG